MSKRSIIWFRRDLRISDHPALLAAISESAEIVPVFILDPKLIKTGGSKRLAYLGQSLRSLDETLNNSLQVIAGDQLTVLKDLQQKYDAESVHISAEYEPYGATRDKNIEAGGIKLIRTGSPYAVAPGRVLKPSDGTPYRVYTPFYKAWCAHGWRKPAEKPKEIPAVKPSSEAREFPDWKLPDGVRLTKAGELAALERFKFFQKNGLDSYDEARNLAAIDGTSKMSAHLKWGEIHPRTLLAPLGESKAHDVFRKEIAWREFYADILFNNPHTETEYYASQFSKMRYDQPGEKFKAWCEGKTGYPIVDACMREINTTGYMHNRGRLIVSNFLCRILQIDWRKGERYFATKLYDDDPAQNNFGWQVSGSNSSGTTSRPLSQTIMSPWVQGVNFDNKGVYFKNCCPELESVESSHFHKWDQFCDMYIKEKGVNYIKPIVDFNIEKAKSMKLYTKYLV